MLHRRLHTTPTDLHRARRELRRARGGLAVFAAAAATAATGSALPMAAAVSFAPTAAATFAPTAAATFAPTAAPFATALRAPATMAGDDPVTLLVSTTGDVGATGAGVPLLDDASVVRVRAGDAPLPWLLDGHWRACLGFAPGDIDGLARRPGAGDYAATGIAFSLLSNEQGFLDGDVLGLAAGGGVEVLVTEDAITAALGVPGAAIDVDAIAFDEQGRLVFSLQSDLAGAGPGDLANGDVLRLEADGTATRIASEADVELALETATGVAAAVGDVHGVEVVGGELWVAVQSPTAHDGGVLALGDAARIVADEATLGLAGEELDGLVYVPSGTDPLALWVDAPGAEGIAACRAGTPNSVAFAVASGAAGFESASYTLGFGAWYVDPLDPLVAQTVASGGFVVLDPSGSYETPFTLPAAGAGLGFDGSAGWTFQLLDLTSLRLSAPYRRDL